MIGRGLTCVIFGQNAALGLIGNGHRELRFGIDYHIFGRVWFLSSIHYTTTISESSWW